MMSGFVLLRLFRSLVIALLLVLFGVLSLSANDAKPGQALWEKKLPDEVLAILNADSNRVTLQAPGEEPVSLVNMSVLEFGQAPLQMLSSPSGVMLLAARDKSPYVQLMAIDVDTGEKLWQIPCTGLPLSELPKESHMRLGRIVSTFMTVRNQVIVVQSADDKSGGPASNILVSYDLRTGTELWRSQANQINPSDMLRQMSPELANKKGISGWAIQKAMKDMNQMASPIANYFLLPQRGVLMKTSTDQTGLGLEALDLDTGQSSWAIHVNPPLIDYSRMMKTRAMQATRSKIKEDPWSVSLQTFSNSIRGDYFFLGCSGPMAEASQGTGQCSSLRTYNINTGKLAWEFQEGSKDMLGWIAAQEIVLVRLPEKIAALKLSTGEKLYEITDNRVSLLASAFAGRTYADGHLIFWVDQKGKDKSLVAVDANSGKILWETPTSREKMVHFIVQEKALVIGTESELILVDKGSGKEALRLKPLSRGPIRTVATPDPQSILVLGDEQIVRYGLDPWKEVFRVVIPSPQRSVVGDILLMALAATMLAMPTPLLGPMPGTYLHTPNVLTPAGMLFLDRLLSDRSAASVQKLEQQSSNFCYFSSGDTIHRVDVTSGKREELDASPSKDALLAIDESRGTGFMIRNHILSAVKIPVDEGARRSAQYSNALELGYWEMHRGLKLESGATAKSVAAYLSAVKNLGDALAAGNDVREKAVVNLALGQAYDRLSILASQDADSWKAKAVKEYTTVRNTTCESSDKDMQELCRAATQWLDSKPKS